MNDNNIIINAREKCVEVNFNILQMYRNMPHVGATQFGDYVIMHIFFFFF